MDFHKKWCDYIHVHNKSHPPQLTSFSSSSKIRNLLNIKKILNILKQSEIYGSFNVSAN